MTSISTLRAQESVAIVGASGLGQEHLAVDHRRAGRAHQRPVRLAGTELFALDEDARAAVRARKLGFVFQSFQLLGNLTRWRT